MRCHWQLSLIVAEVVVGAMVRVMGGALVLAKKVAVRCRQVALQAVLHLYWSSGIRAEPPAQWEVAEL